jgi:hypothetical protein
MHFSVAGEEPSADLGKESETTERECQTGECVKEEKSGGEGNLLCVHGNNVVSRAPSPGM